LNSTKGLLAVASFFAHSVEQIQHSIGHHGYFVNDEHMHLLSVLKLPTCFVNLLKSAPVMNGCALNLDSGRSCWGNNSDVTRMIAVLLLLQMR
jgi:hypothetical protein